jgi:hypothetical protein
VYNGCGGDDMALYGEIDDLRDEIINDILKD